MTEEQRSLKQDLAVICHAACRNPLTQVKRGERNHFHRSKTTKTGYENRTYLLKDSLAEVPQFTLALLWFVIKQVTSVSCITKALCLVRGCSIYSRAHSAGYPCPVNLEWGREGTKGLLPSA